MTEKEQHQTDGAEPGTADSVVSPPAVEQNPVEKPAPVQTQNNGWPPAGNQNVHQNVSVDLRGVQLRQGGNGIAVAGFVLALVAYLIAIPTVFVGGFICWVLAVVFSSVGLSNANKREDRKHRGLAIAGIAISLAPLALVLLLLVLGVLS